MRWCADRSGAIKTKINTSNEKCHMLKRNCKHLEIGIWNRVWAKFFSIFMNEIRVHSVARVMCYSLCLMYAMLLLTNIGTHSKSAGIFDAHMCSRTVAQCVAWTTTAAVKYAPSVVVIVLHCYWHVDCASEARLSRLIKRRLSLTHTRSQLATTHPLCR